MFLLLLGQQDASISLHPRDIHLKRGQPHSRSKPCQCSVWRRGAGSVYQSWALKCGNTQGCDRGTGAPGLHGEELQLPPVTGGSPLVEEPRRASSCYQYFTTPWTASYAQLFHVQQTRKCSYLQHGCPYRLTVFRLEPHSFGLFWVAFKNLWSAVGFLLFAMFLIYPQNLYFLD